MIFILTAIGVYLKFSLDYLGKVKKLNSISIEESLQKKINILSHFIKRLHLYLYVLLSVAFILGIYMYLESSETILQRILFLIIGSLSFLLVFFWLGKQYIHLLYGKYRIRIKELYKELIEGIKE